MQINSSPISRPATIAALLLALPALAFGQAPPPHNVILFVADGLRHGAVDDENMPAMAALRKQGVDFVNSHSLFPTVTTPNASAIATGHYLGDTGDFNNVMFLGFGMQGDQVWPVIHDVENDRTVREANGHFAGSFLNEQTLMAAARQAGLNTAVVGKMGPALIQDVTRNNDDITAANVQTVFIDDATGRIDAKRGRQTAPLRRDIADRIANDPYFLDTYFDGEKPEVEPPTAPRGDNGKLGTHVANTAQQRYLMDTVTRTILPTFADPKGNKKPFVLVYWSRDPDGTQHNAGDSEGKLVPGINSDTVAKAFRDADGNLAQLLDYLRATPDPNMPGKMLADTTDVFITSDHGFGTVSKKQLDRANTPWDTFATRQHYGDIAEGSMPPGIFSIDLAHDLALPLFDAEVLDQDLSNPDKFVYQKLTIESKAGQEAQHPTDAFALIGGGTVTRAGTDASLIVASAGGSELVYFPNRPDATRDADLMRKVIASAAAKPYVSGIWIDTDRFGTLPGALSLADINLAGAARTPRPALVVSFRSFSTDPARPEMTGVQVGDSGYPTGYGTHGTFGRNDTYNCMMALGPDFKTTFSDTDPVSNADIAVTLAKILGIDLVGSAKGQLHGRVISEALAGGPPPSGANHQRKESTPGPGGTVTSLLYQSYKDSSGREYLYFDVGGFAGRSVGLDK